MDDQDAQPRVATIDRYFQGEDVAKEKDWLSRIAVGAFVIWLPVQLLTGVVPATSIHDFLADPAVANVAQVFGALGAFAAVVVALWVAGEGTRKQAEDDRRRVSVAAAQVRARLGPPVRALARFHREYRGAADDRERFDALLALFGGWDDDWQYAVGPELLASLQLMDGKSGGVVVYAFDKLERQRENFRKLRVGVDAGERGVREAFSAVVPWLELPQEYLHDVISACEKRLVGGPYDLFTHANDAGRDA